MNKDSKEQSFDFDLRISKRSPTIIDILIGFQVRRVRKSKNVPMTSIAKSLNLSYQQIQKYERGRSRITASTLFCIATILNSPIEDFFKLADEYLKD